MARERVVRCDMHLLLLLTLPSGPHWGMYEKTKVCINALATGKIILNPCYREFWS
jgi:hypothetical protein